ncbi:MAG: multiheme c-type cytochrome [Oligoflexales bacterium]
MQRISHILLLSMFLPSYATAAGGSDPAWVAFGDFRGETEPCGCDPTTDLGGLERLSNFLDQTRRTHPGIYVFDLGNNFSRKNLDDGKAKTIAASLDVIASSASLFNETEALFFAKNKMSSPKNQTYILTSSTRKQPFVKTHLADDKVLVLGFVEGRSDPKDFLKLRDAFAQKFPGRKKVLLFAGSKTLLATATSGDFFDVVIASNSSNWETQPSPIEKEEPGRLLVAPEIYAVPVFGQGVLLGDALRSTPALGIEKCPGGGECKKEGLSLDGLVPQQSLFAWLTTEFKGPSKLAKVMENLDQEETRLFLAHAAKKKAEGHPSPFVGAQACAACHLQAYEKWKESKHASAYKALPPEKRTNLECVNCHVLGLEIPGGFISEEATPEFASVQCETCHGPRKEHVMNPTVKPKKAASAREVCTSCHHLPHSADFKFNEYWPKIEHGK